MTELDLSYTSVPSLPGFLRDLKKLTKVTLCGMSALNFGKLSEALQGQVITDLDLSDNKIKDFSFLRREKQSFVFSAVKVLNLQGLSTPALLSVSSCGN